MIVRCMACNELIHGMKFAFDVDPDLTVMVCNECYCVLVKCKRLLRNGRNV